MSRPTRKKAKSLFYRLEKDPKDTVRQTTSKNLHLVELPNGECVEVKARDMNMGVETWDTISAISAEFKDALEDTIAKDPKYRRFFNALYIEVRGGKRVPKLYMNLLHAFGGELGIIPNDASLPHVERLLRSKDFEITSTERTNLVDTTCTFMNQEENLITPPGVVPWYQPKTMLPREVNILRLAEKSHLLKRMYSRFAGDSGNNGELHDAFYEFRNVTRRLNRATTPQRKVSPEMQPLPSDPKTTTKNPGKRKENVAQEIVEEAIKKVQPKIGQYQKSDRVVWTGSTPPKGATVIKYQRSKVSTDSKPTNLQTIYQDRELLHIILSEALHQYINSRHDPRNLLPSSVTATQRRDTNLFCGSMLSLIEARYERLKDHIITKHLERVHSAASQDEDRKFLSDFYQWLEDLTPEV